MEENQLPYTVEPIESKAITLTADPAVIWSLHSSDDNTPFVTPVGYSKVGTPLTVNAIAHHSNGNDYYLTSPTQGYAVHDCQDVNQEPVAEPEEPVIVPAGIPGAIHVPLATQRILIKLDLPTYPSPGLAVDRKKPTDRILRQGMQEFDELKYGMLKIIGEPYWVNPADNVLKPVVRPPQIEYRSPDMVLNGAKEAEENFIDFTDPDGNPIEVKYKAKEGGAEVVEFATGKRSIMPAGKAFVMLAGITRVDECGYGIATQCLEDAEGHPLDHPNWVGIMMGMLYEVKPEPIVDRQLKPTDYMVLAKAKLQKSIMDVKSNKRKVQ